MSNLDFEQFEKDWKKRHKASLPRRKNVSSLSTIFWISFWIIVALGAAVFSGTHTLPTAEMTIKENVPYRTQLALTAFVIVEFAVFGSAAGRHQIAWLKYLLAISLGVALIGNLSSSYTAVAYNGGGWLNQIAGVLLSIIAPVTAFAAGEVLHFQIDSLNARRKEADIEYQVAWKEVEAKINAAYTKLEKEGKAQSEAVKALDLIKNNILTEKQARKKPSIRLQKAIDWFMENPDKLENPPRELEEAVGVSYGTIWKAQQHIKEQELLKDGGENAL